MEPGVLRVTGAFVLWLGLLRAAGVLSARAQPAQSSGCWVPSPAGEVLSSFRTVGHRRAPRFPWRATVCPSVAGGTGTSPARGRAVRRYWRWDEGWS